MERHSTIGAINQRQAADASQRRFQRATDRSRLSKSVVSPGLEQHGAGSLGSVRLPPINAIVSAPSRSVPDPWSHVKSKCNSLSNIGHKPGGGRREVETIKLLWRASPKVGSLDNVNHVPGGGAKKIKTRRCVWHAEAKVGSLTNAQHTPGGGKVKISQYKLKFHENALPRITLVTNGDHPNKSSGSKENAAQVQQVKHEMAVR